MAGNVTRSDLDVLIGFLQQDDPRLTQSDHVRAFEAEWSRWLGCRFSTFVNSGSSANLLTMTALRERNGPGEVIVPTLTWSSDIASVLHAGLDPVFVDIDLRTLGMDTAEVLRRLGPRTRAVFPTHVLGFNALTGSLVEELAARGVPLVEDVCEAQGATFRGRKLGTFGLASNFSFYYAHHMTTIEGGMICTDDPDFHETVRLLRSHGMVREAASAAVREDYAARFPDLNPHFIFAFPAYNVRSTEINAVLGRAQLRRLDAGNAVRRQNLRRFFDGLDPGVYRTDFDTEGACSYALPLLLRRPDTVRRDRVERRLREAKVEFRRGMAGGGNQLRQPYLRRLFDSAFERFPNVEHVHFNGFYIGNYPGLDPDRIDRLCAMLNAPD